jgi:hypothetical protein
VWSYSTYFLLLLLGRIAELSNSRQLAIRTVESSMLRSHPTVRPTSSLLSSSTHSNPCTMPYQLHNYPVVINTELTSSSVAPNATMKHHEPLRRLLDTILAVAACASQMIPSLAYRTPLTVHPLIKAYLFSQLCKR